MALFVEVAAAPANGAGSRVMTEQSLKQRAKKRHVLIPPGRWMSWLIIQNDV